MRLMIAFLSIFLALISGCESFQPQPLLPAQAVSAFESRTLDNADLKEFLEKNLHHEMSPWPPKSWDFMMLTLVAFYYQPDLDVARAKRGLAEAGVITAGGRPNPSIGILPQHHSMTAGGLSPWTLSLSLDIPFETAGKRGYRIAQARHLSDAARLNIATEAWKVRNRLKRELLDFYSSVQTMQILSERITVQEEIVRVLEKRLALGEVSRPDVTLLRIALDRDRLSLREAQKKNEEARVRLAGALGVKVDALNGINISFESLELISPNLFPRDVRRQALLNRLDILAALAEYDATQSVLQLEIAKQYPDIHIGPGYSWDQGDNIWSIGFSISLPVFNRNEGPIAEAEARRKEAAAQFSALQARIIGEIDRALVVYNEDLQKLNLADSLLLTHKMQLQSIQKIFNSGEADRLTLLNAQLELYSAELSRADEFARAQQSLRLLEYAVQRPLNLLESFPVISEENPRTKEGSSINETYT